MTTLPFPVPQALFPVQHRFLELDGAHIHYVDEGQGETLLLLHGNAAWCFLYRKIIASLKADFRCVALDYPGYGMSDALPGMAIRRANTVPFSSTSWIDWGSRTSQSWCRIGADPSALVLQAVDRSSCAASS